MELLVFGIKGVNFSSDKNNYVMLGVTGPNEYENNINNNWYTNYIATWCLNYALENIANVKADHISDYIRIKEKTNFSDDELKSWKNVADNMYFPYSEKHKVFLQQDGFLDKELITVANLDKKRKTHKSKLELGSYITFSVY